MVSTRPRERGIYERHSSTCSGRAGGRCDCSVKWQARVWDPHSQRAITRMFADKLDAQAWRVEVQRSLRSGTHDDGSVADVILEQLWADIDGCFQRGVPPCSSVQVPKPSTALSYRRIWKLRLSPELGQLGITDLRRRHVEAVLLAMREQKLAPSTCANALVVVRVVVRVALARELIEFDPTDGILSSRKERSPRQALGAQEVREHLDALDGWLRVFFEVLAYTGLRVGEALALRWRDIDFDKKELQVARNWDPANLIFVEPKTDAGTRTVPLIPQLISVLAGYKSEAPADGLVFPARGNPDRPREYANIVKRASKCWEKAGLEHMSPHDFRHCFVTELNRASLDPRAAADIAGHSDIAFMMSRYVHSDGRSRAAAMEALADHLEIQDQEPPGSQ